MQEKYDELDNIVNTLDVLADEITDEYFLDMINQLKFEAQEKKDEIDYNIWQEEDEEQEEMNIQFERSRL